MATSSEDQHTVDVKRIIDSVKRQSALLHPLSDECCIYRVPDRLRKQNEKAYTPEVVSIGPIHHKRKELKSMEEHKRRYLEDFLSLSKASVEDCVKLVAQNETRLRNCYAETVKLDSEELTEVMLVDAVFILMTLLRTYFESESFLSRNGTDRIFEKPKMIYDVRYDMLLLENQLPFFIVENLFETFRVKDRLLEHHQPNDPSELTMEYLAWTFFARNIPLYIVEKENSSKPKHLLDLLRTCLLPSDRNPERHNVMTYNAPSVTELHQSGVKFQPGPIENMFDLKFNNGVLQIPQFEIFDSTEKLFRNLLAFEQCHGLPGYFCDYIVILGEIIKTPKDVHLLVEAKILEDCSSNSYDASKLFRNLGNGVIVSGCRYGSLMGKLNEHNQSLWPKWKASLKRDYFKAPWAIVSVVAASILLVLTVIQTVCSVLQVFSPVPPRK